MIWVRVTERLPEKAGTYPVFIPTADPKRPMRHVAWFEPDGTPNMSGWQVNPLAASITHWCEWPEDPGEPRRPFAGMRRRVAEAKSASEINFHFDNARAYIQKVESEMRDVLSDLCEEDRCYAIGRLLAGWCHVCGTIIDKGSLCEDH